MADARRTPLNPQDDGRGTGKADDPGVAWVLFACSAANLSAGGFRRLEENATSIETVTPALGKPGWEAPPDFDFHLLVCTGPRCQLRDAASLSHIPKAECEEAGISKRGLTTTTGCIYPCNKGPVVAVYPQGDWFHVPDRGAAGTSCATCSARGAPFRTCMSTPPGAPGPITE